MDSTITNPAAWISGNQLLVVLGTILVALIVPYATYILTRRRQLEAEWRKDKLHYYSQILDSLGKTAPKSYDLTDPADVKKLKHAYAEYAHSYNMGGLVAPQKVANIISKIYVGQRQLLELKDRNSTEARSFIEEWSKSQRELRREMVLAMREDLGIESKDKTSDFDFELQTPLQ